jgi:hypothetical protein
MIEAVESFKLHPTSILNIYTVFEHLVLLWWMGIYMHIHTIIITRLSPDLRELAETLALGDVSVPTIPLQ